MDTRRLAAFLFLLCLPFATCAQTPGELPEIGLSPNKPVSNSPTNAILPILGCLMDGPSYWPEQTVVTRVGQTISINVITPSSARCPAAGNPEISWPVAISLSVLPAGSYTLTARYFSPYYPTMPPYRELMRTFTVADAGSIAAVPTDNRIYLFLLANALLTLGFRAMRIRPMRHDI